MVHKEATDFLRCLDGASLSPHTVRVYAGRVAAFLGWCDFEGVAWHTIGLPDLARFKHFLEMSPIEQGRYPLRRDGERHPHGGLRIPSLLREDRACPVGCGRAVVRTALAQVHTARIRRGRVGPVPRRAGETAEGEGRDAVPRRLDPRAVKGCVFALLASP